MASDHLLLARATSARPSDLSNEQPAKFELALNRKTATALGVTLPQSLLARAEDLID